jgi:hypothetical protein
MINWRSHCDNQIKLTRYRFKHFDNHFTLNPRSSEIPYLQRQRSIFGDDAEAQVGVSMITGGSNDIALLAADNLYHVIEWDLTSAPVHQVAAHAHATRMWTTLRAMMMIMTWIDKRRSKTKVRNERTKKESRQTCQKQKHCLKTIQK